MTSIYFYAQTLDTERKSENPRRIHGIREADSLIVKIREIRG